MPGSGETRIAKALGLKVPVYRLLSATLAEGHDPCWVGAADPRFAGLFPDPFGLELLCEHMAAEEAIERRRVNLVRLLEQGEHAELALEAGQAADEGDIEDLALAVEPMTPSKESSPPEKPEHVAFLEGLRGNPKVARAIRSAFKSGAFLKVESGGEKKVLAGLAELVGEHPLISFDPEDYLSIRRGERAHALKVSFHLPLPALKEVFAKSVDGWPPQEEEAYMKLFQAFVESLRMEQKDFSVVDSFLCPGGRPPGRGAAFLHFSEP